MSNTNSNEEGEMSNYYSNEDALDNGSDSFRKVVRQRISDRTKKVVKTREILSKQAVQTRAIIAKQAVKIAKRAEEHERFINKVTHLLGVLGFGGFCFLLGARPQDIPYVYCLFYVTFVPLRWIYYRFKKWHYYLLYPRNRGSKLVKHKKVLFGGWKAASDVPNYYVYECKIAYTECARVNCYSMDFCYYANTIFLVMLLFCPRNEKFFMVCFSFAEGPLAWALIVWRCSLVFSSVDKIVSVLIHLLPGIVFFTIRWWDPATFEAMHPEGKASSRVSWPYVEDWSFLCIWLFVVPLVAYTLWQLLYFLIVNVLRRQRLLSDPEVMTSYRELSKKARKANNILWRLSGLLGDQNRMLMYILFQAVFTVATMALTVPIFLSYEMHVTFQILKVSASIWNGGSFLLEVMPRQVVQKEKRKLEMKPMPAQPDQSTVDTLADNCNPADVNQTEASYMITSTNTNIT